MELWERFTSEMRRVVLVAHDEAQRRQQQEISSAHLALGLLRVCPSDAPPPALREELERLAGDGPAGPNGESSFTAEAQRVLARAITVAITNDGITRMRKVNSLGVNQRLDQALRQLVRRLETEDLSLTFMRAELDRLVKETPRHPGWLVDLAVGVACASFGRLLGIDWNAFLPVFAAAAIGQFMRRQLLMRQVNVFIVATLIAFLASFISGLASRWSGSLTVDKAMVSAVLLLVPGVPALNAQYDILGGHPTLGNARAVWVGTILIFLTIGVWLSQIALGEGR